MGCSAIAKIRNPRLNTNTQLIISPTKFVIENTQKLSDVYTMQSLIGEGSYGKVYSAVHNQSNQPRAIKIINKRSIRDTKIRFKFINEITILKMLDHPNIIKLYEFFEDTRNYYLVTEYLTGGELLDFILKHKVISEQETASYIKQLLSSVAYLHSRNIVHRDIKLENMIFESAEAGSALKLIDFGTSVIRSPMRNMRHCKGTISYLAPEVIQNKYTEKCDIWSVGVCMYVLLSGKMPFGGRDDKEVLDCIVRGQYKLTGTEWVAVSPQAKDLIRKLIDSNPNTRISAQAALSHEWFSLNPEEEVNGDQLVCVLSNLQTFRATFKMQRAVMCFIASQVISQAEKAELSLLFRSLDTQNNGRITVSDLHKACVRVWGERISKEEIRKIVEAIDSNGNGAIDYSEFIVAAISHEQLLSTERLEAVFKNFDRDGSGKITADEVKAMIDAHDVEEKCWNQLIEEVDSNGDGGVDLKEFKNMMLNMISCDEKI